MRSLVDGFAASADGTAEAGEARRAAAQASTSCFETRPFLPVPVTCARSTSSSSARRRAIGLTRASDSASAPGGAADVACVTAGAVDVGARGSNDASGATNDPMKRSTSDSGTSASANTPISAPTARTSPGAPRIRRSTPETGASTEFTILSVSTSSSASPLWTGCPGAKCQAVTVPSCISMPHFGIVIGWMAPVTSSPRGWLPRSAPGSAHRRARARARTGPASAAR